MSVTSMLLEQAHVIVDVLGWCHDTRGALAPCSGFLPSRPARHLSAVHDAWWFTLVNQVRPSSRGEIRRELPSYI